MINEANYRKITAELPPNVVLVAVSKTKPVADIRALYDLGQRDFGENYVQELVEKAPQLPADIRWHFIGHLQRNKVKLIAPIVHLVHSVDSLKLLQEISSQAAKINRVIDVLAQVHVALEETKFGLDAKELTALIDSYLVQKKVCNHTRICGLMGMATNTEDEGVVRAEFRQLHALFSQLCASPGSDVTILSMGMSSDYRVAMEEGSTMVRIGSLLFGNR